MDKKRVLWTELVLAFATVIAVDRLTKWIALGSLAPLKSIPIIDGLLQLTLTVNTGAAFSILTGKNTFLILISVMVIFFIIYCYFKLPATRVTSIAVGLILGGAIGNLIDRFIYRGIVDFIDFRIFPIFNVADMAITTGVVLLLGYYVWEDFLKKRTRRSKSKSKA